MFQDKKTKSGLVISQTFTVQSVSTSPLEFDAHDGAIPYVNFYKTKTVDKVKAKSVTDNHTVSKSKA